jgi:hypothetical protein
MEVVIGIVGHEAAKFTDEKQEEARLAIHSVIALHQATKVVSGGCHLGGIDSWAIEEAKKLGLETEEFLPRRRSWTGGFRERNIAIAEAADVVVSIVVKELPDSYRGKRCLYCYHCGTDTHVKSGGCWTVKYARKLPRRTMVVEL